MPSSHEILISCRKCNVKVPVKDMKYDLNGKDLICGRCYELRIASASKPKSAGRYTDPKRLKLEFTAPLDGKQEIKYFCTRCKFKFSRKKEHGIPKACPYCNKDSVIAAGTMTADSLLKESSGSQYDF